MYNFTNGLNLGGPLPISAGSSMQYGQAAPMNIPLDPQVAFSAFTPVPFQRKFFSQGAAVDRFRAQSLPLDQSLALNMGFLGYSQSVPYLQQLQANPQAILGSPQLAQLQGLTSLPGQHLTLQQQISRNAINQSLMQPHLANRGQFGLPQFGGQQFMGGFPGYGGLANTANLSTLYPGNGGFAGVPQMPFGAYGGGFPMIG